MISGKIGADGWTGRDGTGGESKVLQEVLADLKIITSNFVGQLWPSDDDDDDNDHWWDFEIPSIIIAEKNHYDESIPPSQCGN